MKKNEFEVVSTVYDADFKIIAYATTSKPTESHSDSGDRSLNNMNANMNEFTEKLTLEENSEIQQLFQSLWESKLLILCITAVVLLIAAVYTVNKQAVYEGSILLQIDDKNQDNSFHLPQLHLGNNSTNEIAFQSALIQSKVILEPIVAKLGLDITIEQKHFPILGRFFTRQVNQLFSIKYVNATVHSPSQQYVLKVIDDHTYALFDSANEQILTGTTGKPATANNGELSMQIDALPLDSTDQEYILTKSPSQRVINQLISKLHVQQFGDTSDNQTGILQVTLKDTDPVLLSRILNEIATNLQSRSVENKLLESSHTLKFLNQQLPLVKASLEKAEYELNHYRATSGNIDIKILTEQLMEQVARVEKQIIETKLKKSNLLQIYTEKYPLIIELNNTIAGLTKIKKSLIKKVKSLPETDQVAINLMRDAKVKNDLYLILLNKIQELRVVSSGTLSDVRILESAVPPDAELPRQTSLTMVASLILGLMLGGIVILIQKSFLRRVTDPCWAERSLNIPNLAMIPYSSTQTKNKTLFKQKLAARINILAESNPQDLSIEALRSLRTSFEMFLTNPQKKVINITGVSEGVGKSFVSVNFSTLLANLGKRVLLIDGDIRRGDLHSYFGLKQSPGLHELVDDKATLADTLKQTPIEHLSFISCGTYPERAAELLMKPAFKQLFVHLREQFDYIIIDTAPVLAVTDSTIVALSSDITFLVIGSDLHTSEEIILSVKRLENAGVKISGTIFNNLSKKNFASRKYRHYYYSYSSPK